MNRSKVVLSSIRYAYSLLSTRSSSAQSQVSCFQYSSRFDSSSIPNRFQYQHRFFSSTLNPIDQLILENDWSDVLVDELEKPDVSLSHENAIYILRKLNNDPEKAYCFFNWAIQKKGFRPSSSFYCSMLQISAQNRSMKQFWVTLRKMREGSFYLDENTYSTIRGVLRREKLNSDFVALAHFYDRMLKENATDAVAKRVSEVISKSDWDSEVERELEEMKLVLSDNFVIRILRELRDHPLKALEFFNWIDGLSSYEHCTITYNAILRVLARPNSIEEFWNIVDKMKSLGHEMDLDTYIKVSRLFQKSKMMGDAVKLYEFMMDSPFKPSPQDCSLLLRTLASEPVPNLDLVFRVVRKYESMGHLLSKAVYDGIHRSLTSVGRFEEAEEIINTMRGTGYEPDNITYSQLVYGLCKMKRLDEACEVIEQMEAKQCVADIKTWTILIQGHCKANEVEKALMCLAKMLEKGFDIDSELLDVLVNGFICQNSIEGAYKFLAEMVKMAKVKPYQATYKNLIEKLLEFKKYEEALDLLGMMKKQNYPAYSDPFDQYLGKFGTVEEAKGFLKALSSKDYPSSGAYLHVFEAFFKEGRHSEAKDLFYSCPHHVRMHPKISELFGAA